MTKTKLENDFSNDVNYYVIKNKEVVVFSDFKSTQQKRFKDCVVVISSSNNFVYFRTI